MSAGLRLKSQGWDSFANERTAGLARCSGMFWEALFFGVADG